MRVCRTRAMSWASRELCEKSCSRSLGLLSRLLRTILPGIGVVPSMPWAAPSSSPTSPLTLVVPSLGDKEEAGEEANEDDANSANCSEEYLNSYPVCGRGEKARSAVPSSPLPPPKSEGDVAAMATRLPSSQRRPRHIAPSPAPSPLPVEEPAGEPPMSNLRRGGTGAGLGEVAAASPPALLSPPPPRGVDSALSSSSAMGSASGCDLSAVCVAASARGA
mmetsp:Transcript_39074/g.103097  ORF Transcript_39074/g.103097 Transcript_39074/m.103097 type:complete len:220 (-) Transcript_39074:87-746(-)